MKRHKQDGLEWLTFDLLADFPLVHGVFLRHGGVSCGHFNSLNFGVTQGDDPKKVQTNRQLALQTLGISNYCLLNQYHGKKIVTAKPGQSFIGDGMLTNTPGIGALILHADCQAAIFYDPIHHAAANIHCGWRGNVQNIYQEAVLTMHSHYGSKPENLLVGISPSLGPHASEFIHYKTELPESFYPYQFKPNYFNLWEISRSQLLECGILPHHIEISGICTFEHPEDFFSYRRKKESGRHGTVLMLQ